MKARKRKARVRRRPRGLLTTTECALLAGVGATTIRRACLAGDLPHCVIPSSGTAGSPHRRIDPRALRRWLVANGVPTAALDREYPPAGESVGVMVLSELDDSA
jgi:hypothetical protein